MHGTARARSGSVVPAAAAALSVAVLAVASALTYVVSVVGQTSLRGMYDQHRQELDVTTAVVEGLGLRLGVPHDEALRTSFAFSAHVFRS